jgi:hypothetical protein
MCGANIDIPIRAFYTFVFRKFVRKFTKSLVLCDSCFDQHSNGLTIVLLFIDCDNFDNHEMCNISELSL